ncbi:sigma-70 family RNA polymerase sigma factor [Streptomyces polygonati]|uniref:Sigma-70 family RNA polymerase sigma factor n=1 Tax=Streptomyces polygonati TaxID=1617087 RepID=A0ABV8HDE2_9ACTN
MDDAMPDPGDPAARPVPDPWWKDQVDEAYRAHQEGLLRFVRAQARAWQLPESALDSAGVVQETFVRAMRKWPEIRDPKPWLYKVAQMRVREIAHEVRMSAGLDMAELDESSLSGWSSMSPQATVEDTAFAHMVVDQMRELSGKQAKATFARHVMGMPSGEIGDRLGSSPEAIRVHVFRGTRVLRQRWSGVRQAGRRGRPLLSDALAVVALGALLCAAATVVLTHCGVPMTAAVVGPPAVVVAALSLGWVAWRVARRPPRPPTGQ